MAVFCRSTIMTFALNTDSYDASISQAIGARSTGLGRQRDDRQNVYPWRYIKNKY
jgi:hypothetical protein